jgi:hypothetical protein
MGQNAPFHVKHVTIIPMLAKAHAIPEDKPTESVGQLAPFWLRITYFVSGCVIPVSAILCIIALVTFYPSPQGQTVDQISGIAGLMLLGWTIWLMLLNSLRACFRGSAKAAWIVAAVAGILAFGSVAFVRHEMKIVTWELSLAGSMFAYYLITVGILHARLAHLNQRAGSVSYKHVRGRIFGARA